MTATVYSLTLSPFLFYQSHVCSNLDGNPISCEELDVVLEFLCSDDAIQTDNDLSCTFDDETPSTLGQLLRTYCNCE